jgi:tetratricopeptide (TPR) repeat protein
MVRLTALCLTFVLTIGSVALAQELQVAYLDGRLEVLKGGRWQEIASGEAIPSGAALRLDKYSVAELAAGEARITLSQPGTYSTAELLRTYRESSRWGVARLVAEKLRALFSRRTTQPMTAMALRGEQIAEEQGMGWMDEEQEALDNARQLLADGRYKQAVAKLEAALATAGPEARAQYLYLIGYGYSMAGGNGPALKALEQVEAPASAPYFADYVLLKSRLLAEGEAYGRALELLDSLPDLSPAPEVAQPALFLSAYCAQQLGDAASARQRLLKAQALDPESEIGRQAAEMLEGL